MYEKITYYSRMSQTLHVPVPVGGGGGGDSAAYTNFIARTSGLDDTHKNAYKDLLNGLTTDGLFNSDGSSSKLDALWVPATADRTTAKLNLVSVNFGLTEVTYTANFTVDVGYVGDAAFYIDSGYNPTGGPNWTLNSASLGMYNTGVATTVSREMGGQDLAGVSVIFPNSFGNLGDVLNGTTSPGTTACANANGLFICTTTNGSNIKTHAWNSTFGGSEPIENYVSAVGAIANVNFYIMGFNNNGSVINVAPVDFTLSAAFAGAGLTDADALAIARRLNTYMTVYGISQYSQP